MFGLAQSDTINMEVLPWFNKRQISVASIKIQKIDNNVSHLEIRRLIYIVLGTTNV
mgnify:CR=1 FL=1